ncbi:MAG: MATE family efflux transporter [Tannerellaceae bacterium]|nr:MATE family efflux transporter [Tannerellaceae bacterium]
MINNRTIWRVSYPVFLSLLAQNIINVTDTAFLGRVGEIELGASALGGLYYICAFTIAFGFSTGSQIVIARRNGEGEYGQIGPVMIQGIFFLFALATLLFSFTRLFSMDIMRFLISSDTVLDATSDFLYWRVPGFFFSFVNVMFRAFFVGITRTKVLTLNAFLMAIINIILDYLLIFGHAGCPEMGLKGAAIASVIAEAASVLFFLVYTRMTVDIRKYGLNRFRSFDFGLLKRVLNISVFTMLQYFVSMSTFMFFFIAVERIGQRELAVANIVRSIYILLYIPVNALSTTTSSLVSNTIGAGEIHRVIPLVKKITRLSFIVMALFSAVICLMPETILSVYTNDATLIADSVKSIYVIAGAMLICATSSIFFNAVSGTGNTRSALLIELLTLVLYCVYVYLAGMQLKLPVHICFASEVIYYTSLLVLSALYLHKGQWQNRKI